MRFASVPTAEAVGAILAHSLGTPDGPIKKGRVLSAGDVARLQAAGHETVMAARLDPGDLDENAAAGRVARALAGSGVRVAEPFTGRANLYAEWPGLVTLDPARIGRLNGLDEALTVATVVPFERVEAGQMIATVKIITFGLSGAVVAAAEPLAAAALAVAPFAARTAGLVLTELPATKTTVLDKRTRVMADRLAALGSRLGPVLRVPHETAAVAAAITELATAGADPILVFAASAIVDRGDVTPAALVAAGGTVVHLGMPVDPGNLLMVGRLGPRDVIGVPSCAASPKLNGFDWVLERRLAGQPVGPAELAALGVGGLLKEISGRPQPREGAGDDDTRRAPRVGAILLAAGRSTRMGAGRMKLLEPLDGVPLVRHTTAAALASGADPVVVVTGHAAEAIEAALDGLDVAIVRNPRFTEGLSTSLKAGLAALPDTTDAALVLLGDMPTVTAATLRRLIAAFAPKDGRHIIVPVRDGRRGNPVLWGRSLFPAIGAVTGDHGARHLLGANAELVVEVEISSDEIFLDVDTPEALLQLTGRTPKDATAAD
ncbi:MAG: NTP transferase domain-containing protein [Hyphomicrobiaceae bacterium]